MDEPKRHSRWPITVAAIILVPVLYVLSVGPMMWINSKWPFGPRTRDVVSVVYYPLEWSYRKSETAHQFFDWYFSLWVQRGP